MNNLFVSNLGVNSNQLTTTSTPFVQADFYGISGFGANGKPVFNTGIGWLGTISGNQPLVVNTGVSVRVTPFNGAENLAKYWYTPANAGDGIYITYL
jgi:hypothetical protein